MVGFRKLDCLLQLLIRVAKRIPLVGRLAEGLLARSPRVRRCLARIAFKVHRLGTRGTGADDLSPQSRLIYADITSAMQYKGTHADSS